MDREAIYVSSLGRISKFFTMRMFKDISILLKRT